LSLLFSAESGVRQRICSGQMEMNDYTDST